MAVGWAPRKIADTAMLGTRGVPRDTWEEKERDKPWYHSSSQRSVKNCCCRSGQDLRVRGQTLDRGSLRGGKQPAAAIRVLLSTVRVQGASPKSHHSQGNDTVNQGRGLGILESHTHIPTTGRPGETDATRAQVIVSVTLGEPLAFPTLHFLQ